MDLNFIRDKVRESGGVFFIDQEAPNFDIIKFDLIDILFDDGICTVQVPDKYYLIYQSKEITLNYNNDTKHLYTNRDYQLHKHLGWNIRNANFLRRKLIANKIHILYCQVERLIILKNEAIKEPLTFTSIK